MLSANSKRIWIGAAASFAVALTISAMFVLIWYQRGEASGQLVDIGHLLRMSSIQAGLTTVLSLGVGATLAWALNRVRFRVRALLVSLLSAALVTPGIVVAVGLVSVWGRSGWLNSLLDIFGLQTGSIFGLQGILYAHVILDATFAAAILLAQLDAIPANRLKLGQNLRLSPWVRFRTLDWPVLAPALPALGAIIFLLAFTSFPIVLTLGGGPANQTFEVAIYTAIRLDFDLQSAVILALIQLGLCAILILPATLFALSPPGTGAKTPLYWPDAKPMRTFQFGIIIVSTIGLGFPLLSVLIDGLSIGPLLSQPRFWQALVASLTIGTASAVVSLILGTCIVMAKIAAKKRIFKALIWTPSYAYLAVPGVTLSLGFFLGARALGLSPSIAAPYVLIVANALLALPYSLATLAPAFEASSLQYGRLAQSLALSNWQRFRWVEWPSMGRQIGLVFAMSFCFSLGDLSVIALFGTQDFSTLPWLMSRALGAYRTNDAAAIAAFLLILSTVTFLVLPPIFERIARAHSR